jgi:hypothetical protein
MTNTLHTYLNGNTTVSIHSDGTKVRSYEGKPRPVHPESMDIKITNACDGGCAYCHEKSVPSGKHADLNKLLEMISDLPAGVELALGGGNPLSHPDLVPFLRAAKDKGLIVNMTVNQQHVVGKYGDLLLGIVMLDLIHGLGISYSSKYEINDMAMLMSESSNIVFHMIMGVNEVEEIDDIIAFSKEMGRDSLCNKRAGSERTCYCKILVLGYKQYGRGLTFYDNAVEANKAKWYTQLAKHFRKEGVVMSFDNLAIKQLKLKRYFTDDAWSKFYMGDDGTFTMYVDAVEQTFAKSSTSNDRVKWQDKSLIEFFQGMRGE